MGGAQEKGFASNLVCCAVFSFIFILCRLFGVGCLGRLYLSLVFFFWLSGVGCRRLTVDCGESLWEGVAGLWLSGVGYFLSVSRLSLLIPVPSYAQLSIITIYAPMIYTALCIMFWMRAYPLRGEMGGGWAREFSSFLGPEKWHRKLKI